jgi:molybdopterin converting factor small subunit
LSVLRIVVKLFGPQAQTAGRRELALDLAAGPVTCAALRCALAAAEPRLAPTLPASRFAINCALAAEADAVRAGDEVALIGPVSGG